MEGIEAAEESGLKHLLIAPDELISTALRQMDESGDKILIVVDEQRKLLGIATDGDIRRWLIAGNKLDAPISAAMNPDPLALGEGYDIEDARQILVTKKIDCVPVIAPDRTVTSAIWWVDLFETQVPVRGQVALPVVIMAGGEGVRMSPFTKVLPKPLIPIGETPIIELIIERFQAFGCRDFRLSVNYKANLIKAYFADLAPDYDVSYLEEGAPLGTAGSLTLLRNQIEGTFFLSNCDILVDADYADIVDFHREQGNLITIVASAKQFTVPYGVCEVGAGGRLEGLSEKPSFDFLVSTGMYVMDASVLVDIPEGRIYHVTDLANDYVRRGLPVGVYPVSEKSWLDMGQWEEFQDMRTRLGLA